VLAGEQPARLAFLPTRHRPIQVRSTYRDNLPQTIHYEEGRDYIVDYQRGEIRRTPQSRIPDFRTNMLFGVEDFDHSKFPGFGNTKFFVFVDYASKEKIDWIQQASQIEFLPKTREKLRRGESVKIVAFGDSITAGGEATDPKLIYWQRWADFLQQKYPQAKIEAINGATGGDRTAEGFVRLQEKVLKQHPDLVLIAFGMNDHNIAGFGTPVKTFSENLAMMIDRIRQETGAEIILLSTFPPNPKWHYGSHNMKAFALATEQVAREKHCAYADIYSNWTAFAWKKKPEDLLGNNINHPNDFGHGIYFEVLKRIGL
jgi:lysophospholipase L1-like esterase